VTDSSGKVLESYQPQPQQVLEPQIARQINDILSDNVARTPEFGAESPLQFDAYDVADKTGTTNDFRDVWVLGYTPSIAVGAWAGNNDNSAMAKKIAAFIIAPMWHEFMLEALQKYSSTSDTFPPPAPDPDIASLPPVLTGNWNTDPSQGVHDILYWVNKDSPRSGAPNRSDSQFAYWDYPVQLWAQQNPALISGATVSSTAPSAPPAAASGFLISSPEQGAVVPFDAPVMFASVNQSSFPITSVSYYVNGYLVGTVGAPYLFSFTPGTHGVLTLRAVGFHPDGSSAEQTITFTVR
jgi:membrane peptidoglycan carboxypeptidase